MYTFAVILATLVIVYVILEKFGVFEFAARPRKTAKEIEDKRSLTRKRRFEQKKLSVFSSLTNLFRGILMTESAYESHLYYIHRLDIRTKYLGRQFTPEELRGQHSLFLVLSIIILPLAVFVPPLVFVVFVALFRFVTYQTMLKAQINDEDEIVDNNFINLYLLLYSKLRQGSRARLQPSVENYIDVLQQTKQTPDSVVMLKFSRYFLNLLAQYEDHVAIPYLKDEYRSATVVNFCNVAAQALQGIDNFDNLLTFKMQLTERKTNLMRKRQQIILRKGERSIFAIWIILFIFIAVGWYSKLPTGFF